MLFSVFCQLLINFEWLYSAESFDQVVKEFDQRKSRD